MHSKATQLHEQFLRDIRTLEETADARDLSNEQRLQELCAYVRCTPADVRWALAVLYWGRAGQQELITHPRLLAILWDCQKYLWRCIQPGYLHPYTDGAQRHGERLYEILTPEERVLLVLAGIPAPRRPL